MVNKCALLGFGAVGSEQRLLVRVAVLYYEENLTQEEVANEYLLMGLRLVEGIDPARFARLAGRALDGERISLLRAQGLIEATGGGTLRASRAGFPVLDAVVADLAA